MPGSREAVSNASSMVAHRWMSGSFGTPRITSPTMSRRTLEIDDVLHQYLIDHTAAEHPAQTRLRAVTARHPHAGMQISVEQAQFMQLLAKLIGARRAIEIGVFTGYSALSVALALPRDGLLLACDVSDEYTRVGRPYWQDAGVAERIELVLGPALETLDRRIAAGDGGTFDFAFIDADKTSYDAYFERCLVLLAQGWPHRDRQRALERRRRASGEG